MPAYTYTTNQLVRDAYALIAVIDENDTLSANQLMAGISIVNQILSADEQAGTQCPYFKTISFNFIPNQTRYEFSLEPSADIVTSPLSLVADAQLLLEASTRVPIEPRNHDQFKNTMKFEQSIGQPQQYLFTRQINKSFIEFWPAPNSNWKCEVYAKQMFSFIEPNSDLPSIPSYYYRYLTYSLAKTLAGKYNDAMWTPINESILNEMKTLVKSTSDSDYSLQVSPALLATRLYPIANNLILP